MKKLLLGTILGGLVAFVWSMVSWEVLGWHEKSVRSFPNEDAVTAVLTAPGVASGVYLFPGGPPHEGMTAEQVKAADEAVIERMQKGPIMFAAVRSGGFKSFPLALGTQLAGLMTAAFLLTWLLLQTTGLSYAKRVVFLGVAGLAAGVIVEIPNWNWWGFSTAYTAVNIIDFTLMWTIAGLVIARVARPEPRS